MAGISVTLDGDNIELSFKKDERTTAVVMDPKAARSLVRVLDHLLSVIGEDEAEAEAEGEDVFEDEEGEAIEPEGDLLDVTSPTIDVGVDEGGQPVVALQAGELPPFLLRLKDEEARHIAASLLEILNAPRDARASQGGH